MFSLDSALGIEIRENCLVLASVQKGFQEFRLRSHLVIEGFRQLPVPELASRIHEFSRANGFSRENIVVGVPRDWVVFREIELPIEVEENLDGVVRAQVEKFEPVEEEQSYFDYQVRGRDEAQRRISLEVLMARREAVDEILELLRGLDLYPAVVTVSSLGLQSVLSIHEDGTSRKSGVLILKLEPGWVELVAHAPNSAHFSEVLNFEVEDPEPENVLQKVAETLSAEVDRFSSFSKLYLTGSLAASRVDEYSARLADTELLSKGLGIRHKAISASVLTNLTSAIGLGVAGVKRKHRLTNLIPPDKRVVRTHASLVATYILGILLVLSLGALVTRGYLQQSALADQVDSVIADLNPEVEQIFRIRDEVEKKKQELSELKSLMGDRQETLLVLRDLTDRIPDDTYLQNLQIQGDQLTMQGYSVQASALLSVLSESPYLESVKTNWITQDPRVSGKERFNFTAKVK